MQPLHYLRCQFMLIQKCNTAKGSPIIINRMPKMDIGIEIRPTNLDFFNKASILIIYAFKD